MFKKSLAIALLAALPAVAFAQSPPPAPQPAPQPTKPRQLAQWITCITLEGGYRIDMPGLATARTKKIDLKDGQSATEQTNEVAQGPLSFSVGYRAYPKGYLVADSETFFARLRNAFAAENALVRQRVLDGHSREFLLLHEGKYVAARVVLIGDRVFQVTVDGGASADFDQDTAVRRFLDSFRIQA